MVNATVNAELVHALCVLACCLPYAHWGRQGDIARYRSARPDTVRGGCAVGGGVRVRAVSSDRGADRGVHPCGSAVVPGVVWCST